MRGAELPRVGSLFLWLSRGCMRSTALLPAGFRQPLTSDRRTRSPLHARRPCQCSCMLRLAQLTCTRRTHISLFFDQWVYDGFKVRTELFLVFTLHLKRPRVYGVEKDAVKDHEPRDVQRRTGEVAYARFMGRFQSRLVFANLHFFNLDLFRCQMDWLIRTLSFAAWRERKKKNELCKIKIEHDCLLLL